MRRNPHECSVVVWRNHRGLRAARRQASAGGDFSEWRASIKQIEEQPAEQVKDSNYFLSAKRLRHIVPGISASNVTPRLVRAIQVKKGTSDCQPETSFEPISHLQSFECGDTKEQEKYSEVGTQPYLSHFTLLYSLTVACVDRTFEAVSTSVRYTLRLTCTHR